MKEGITYKEWQKLKRIFNQAIEIDEAERKMFVDKACGEDRVLKKEVLSLLKAHEIPGKLDYRPDHLVKSAFSRQKTGSRKGEQIGPYKILDELGHGGMGSVFLAERADGQFRQQVALKLLRTGFTSENQTRRFLAERQILASLNHENIARLLDGGVTGDGQPWFALEYVDGHPIDVYCNERQLTLKQRLNLFLKVCDAVQTAHRKLIIHRDLKPSNVLVTEDGTVKLLDFGIAKVLNQEDILQESVPLTRTGLLPLTPAYASPEQVRGEPITTASDIYQLGVMLYELLTGFRPYTVSGKTPSEVERIICEEEPTWPSTAVTKPAKAEGDHIMEIPEPSAGIRKKNPEQLQKHLRGDLDIIVMKSLRKEPDRRYESADQLAADIRFYLTGKPVAAHPDSRKYRAGKFIQRHKTGFMSTLVIVLLLIGYAVTITWHSQQTQAALEQAQTETARAEQITDYLLGLFEASDPAETLGDTVTAGMLLERGIQQAEQLDGQPQVQAEMFDIVGQVYSRLGQYGQAEELLNRALQIRNEIHGEYHETTAATKVRLATALHLSGNYDEAEPLLRDALTVQEQILEPEDPAVASTLSTLGGVLKSLGKYDEAEAMLYDALELQRRIFETEHLDISETLNILGLLMERRGDLESAGIAMREALEIRRNLLSDLDPRVTMSLNNLGMLLRKKGDYEAAEPFYREALSLKQSLYGENHPSIAVTLNGLGLLLRNMGNDEAAEPVLREALDMRRELLDENHLSIGESLNNLGNLLEDLGQLEEAASKISEAHDILKSSLGAAHPIVAYPAIGLARILMKKERPEEAEPLIRTALEIRNNALPAGHTEILQVKNMLGFCLTKLGQYREAESFLLKAFKSQEAVENKEKDLWKNTLEHIIWLYEDWGQHENVTIYQEILADEYSD